MKYAFEIDTCLGDPSRINSELSLSRHFLTNYLTRAHTHTRTVFTEDDREYRCVYRSADRTIRPDRSYAICVEGYRVLAWESDTFTRGVYPPGLVIVVRQMFQLAVYAAIVVLTRHKIPIVSRGGEKRGREAAFRGSLVWR